MIDPNIALQVRQPEFHDPLQSYAKIAGVRNMITQNALHQQQILTSQEALKSHQLANAETVRAQEDAAKFQQAHMDAGGNVDQAVEIGRKNGVRLPYLNKVIDERNKQVEQLAKTDKEKLLAADEKTNFLHQRAAGLDQIADPAEQQTAWDAMQPDLVKSGAFTAPRPYPGKDEVHRYAVQLTTLKDITTAAKAKQDADEAKRKEQLFPSQLAESEDKAVAAHQKATGTEPIQPQQAATLAQTKFNESEMRKIQARNADTAAGHLAETRRINAMEYGPGQVDNWVENLKANPDSVKELPMKLRGVVGQKFKEATGLPLPTPLTGGTQSQETSARNTLDNAQWLADAIKNPLISGQSGPLLGRLGNAEQRLGTAVGLSPEAERLGQEFRTRARQFLLQDAKAMVGGRLSPQLLKQLEDVSANPKMDTNLFQGALDGAIGNANGVLENADKQRFGGKARTPEMRGMKAATPAAQVVRFKSGATNYNIPADQVADFLKDHPNAVKQ